MDLFSKIRLWWRGRARLSERELSFNSARIQRQMRGHADRLNEFRGTVTHEAFVDFLRTALEAEMLRVTTMGHTDLAAFAYQRGKIDGIRQVLDLREKFLLDRKEAKKTGKAESVRTYVHQKAPANSAGLSV